MDLINLNIAVKFFLSFSVFSIILSQSSVTSFVLYFFNAFVSSPSMKLFSYTFDKNYMFLLCNGLVVFIVKNSGLIGASPSECNLNNDEHAVKMTNGDTPESVAAEMVETEEPEAEEDIKVSGNAEEDRRVFVTENEEEEEDSRNDLTVSEDDHDEFGEEDDENVLLSTEELNRKCDDFIRKVKEGIKLEVQQSLAMF